MELGEIEQLRGELGEFVAEVFASVRRRDQRAKGDCYLRGLMLDGRRKSIQPMAERLPDGDMQALQQFVNQSPWDHVAVLRAVAVKTVPAVDPLVWVIDDVSFPKDGKMSVAVARQWCGALGKQSNCQVAVSLHAASDTASVPISWRLFLPQEWQDDTARRAKAGVPEEAGHREKWRLALDLIDEAIGWGLEPKVIVADAGYGQNNAFRQALTERGLDFVVAVRADETAHRHDAVPTAPAWSGNGRKPAARYRTPALSLKDLAAETGRQTHRQATWRKGSKGPMRSKFRVRRVRPAGVAARRHAIAQAGGPSAWDGVLPALTLLSQWPTGEKAPTEYWLTSLPADTPLRRLVRLAKMRWRIEHDYREMKHGLGLDHFEGRTWRGWHHHATLVTAAHAFLTLHRLDPKAHTPA
ncbi:IS701 family transposase [Streptomyces sp. V1I6]|uniref:IS701 family transposase n=1 Tax=Streptomyces sp. V1I6 TaxID=3042273 RepID=UPI0027837300|nr:IS701 family transposase [Streptomyces sp. V1I6]MDQ0843159.1 SRSO17 transposase [Streptomyces sp. V1I6]MDQ0845671.1 SRSO17 transposase [Streptomyces sp. V1I6]MDQ0846114.1 SRSO17 transposase [Streptomyces sp. V1I6]MDQ0846415.1 SRSO17 transposase [Streptomyces sp. V1I6]MDQ0847128.1 SRSO17 transposase [Streptomyces sp. V1I6]